MTTPKTIRVKRKYAKGNQFTSDDGMYELILCNRESDELDITITPVKSLKQQRREARVAALIAANGPASSKAPLSCYQMVEIIERVDAEFDQAREAEVTGKLRVALEDFWRLRLRAYEDGIPSRMKLAYESAREAIEAIYRGER